LWRRLVDGNVLVRDVGGFHPRLEGCLRLTIGTPAENDALLAAFRASLGHDPDLEEE
jgi:histidinol-phosphate aminotransferase